MCKVVDFRNAENPRDVIHQAVHVLAEGGLVGFPTETSYVIAAHALKPAAVQSLRRLVDADESSARPSVLKDDRTEEGSGGAPGRGRIPLVLTVKGAQEAVDYLPRMNRLGRKLARRCWPGPVTLAFPAPEGEGLLHALPVETQSALICNGEVQVRVPAHDAVQEVLKLTPAPLVTSPEVLSDGFSIDSAAGLQSHLDRRGFPSEGCPVALIVDDGVCRYDKPSTVVRVSDNHWTVAHAGIVSETVVRRLASEVYLFVCTGNTCRSPLAEGLFRKMIAERLQCREEETFDRGFVVVSAGLGAGVGSPASAEAIQIAARKGVDLRTHVSQPLTDRLIHQADHVYTMTRAHLESMVATWPEVSDRVELLSRDHTDIADPIGGGFPDYERCEHDIQRHVRAIVDAIRIE